VNAPGPANTEAFTTGNPHVDIKRMASLSAFGLIGKPEDIANMACLVSDKANLDLRTKTYV
jgi:3-oxoacyl-[acyl-carrier protein] reductase